MNLRGRRWATSLTPTLEHARRIKKLGVQGAAKLEMVEMTELEKRRKVRALKCSRRNQPPTVKYGSWQCEECDSINELPFEPGCFVKAFCPSCSRHTEHAGAA